jgi:hypothetical protein
MRQATLLLLVAAALSGEPQESGRRPVIPPGDRFPWCLTGRVWTGPLSVRVLEGAGGDPVAGIPVALGTGAMRVTDASGIARFERADSTDSLRIRAVGYRPYEGYVPEDEEEHRIELEPGIPLRGRVLLAAGTPARGARAVCWDEWGIRMLDAPQVVDGDGRFTIVAVERAKPVSRGFVREEPEMSLQLGGGGVLEGVVDPPGEVYVREAHRSNPLLPEAGEEGNLERIAMETAFARSDARGRYRIDGLALPGAYVVCTGASESAIVELSAERPRAKIDLSGAAGRPRSVRILDEHGKPLAGEWTALAGPTRQQVVESSPEGVVEVPPGDWRVEVDGYLSAPAAPEVRLDRGITIRGSAAPGKWVYAVQPLPGGRYASQSVTADAEGRFAISGLVEGDAWLTDGREPEGPGDGRIRVRARMEDVAVAFPATASVVGRIEPPPPTVDPRGPAGSVVTLEPDGSFRVQGIPAGREVVLDLSFDEGKTRYDILCPALEVGGVRDLGTLHSGATASVTGVVEDAGGHPVEGAALHLAVGNPYEKVYTDGSGRFSLPVRPVAPVVLKAAAEGFAAKYMAVARPGTVPVRVTLDPGGLVRGRVFGAGGSAVAGAYIVFWRRLDSGQVSPCEDWKPDVDSTGRFEIRLPPGTYHVRFYDMAFSHARVPGPDVTVGAGGTQEIEIRLP